MNGDLSLTAEKRVNMEFFNHLPSIRYMAGIMYDSTWAEKFHKSSNHEFLHVLSGKIRLIFKEDDRHREYFASPGESLIVPAGTLHRDDFDFKEDLKVLYVNFSWDAADFFQVFNNSHLSHLPLGKRRLFLLCAKARCRIFLQPTKFRRKRSSWS